LSQEPADRPGFCPERLQFLGISESKLRSELLTGKKPVGESLFHRS
jgi:hypothetical protein